MKKLNLNTSLLATIALSTMVIQQSAAFENLDFETDPDVFHGDPFTFDLADFPEPMEYSNVGGVNLIKINARANGGSFKPVLFDSTADIVGGGNDDDLQTPGDANGIGVNLLAGPGNSAGDWAAGDYLFGDPQAGAERILIVQKNPMQGQAPNDYAKGGSLVFDFSEDVRFDAFGIVDLESANKLQVIINGDGQGGEGTGGYTLNWSGVIGGFGENSYFEKQGLGLTDVSLIEFKSTTSYAVSGIRFAVVPEPATVFGSLFGLGMIGYVGFQRRRRNH